MKTSNFIKILGGTPRIKVLDFLILGREYDHTKSDITGLSNVSFNTVNGLLDILIKDEIVKKTRKTHNSQMYQINEENIMVQAMIKFHEDLKQAK